MALTSVTNKDDEKKEVNARELILKALKNLTFRYRLFATGFLFSIGLMAMAAYFIHPGLAALIVTTYITYFMRVNLINIDGQRQQLEQTIQHAFNQAQKGNPLGDHHKGAYL